MHSASLPLFTPTPSIITINPNPNPNPKQYCSFNGRKSYDNSLTCKASTSSSSSLITDFDLYDLLGVDNSSDQVHIKMAYRTLQKRCHPDIAGQAGHDMAIILNQAYAILSDPISRFAYDKEQARVAGLRGYTGKPIYSVWFGSESEERAVFVDEVKCVGCLKCALFADKTFAIESAYGRARVVAQWADPESKIQQAIETCPVNCISMVERSNLAALEFLMSKQPRGNVRIGAGNTGGTCVSNIFVDVEKFQARFQDAMDKASTKNSHSKESEHQWEARMSAIQTIRAISNWLYWQPPSAGGGGRTSQTRLNLKRIAQKSTQPNINKLRDAATARKQARETKKPHSKFVYNDEYWIPSNVNLPEPTKNSPGSREYSSLTDLKELNNENFTVQQNIIWRSPFAWGFPMVTATVSAVIVWLQIGERVVAVGLKRHIGGSLAVDIVKSSWSQVILASVTWYLIGMAVVELVQALPSKR